ncbi:MAG: hypothetical protein HUK09_06420 [Bacteroidaceae bacterium]|nr:hypothetical protein [Bacteroidaceae bacterium]
MASRRNLKKVVKSLCGELFTDCALLLMTEQGDKEKLRSLMREVITLNNEFVARISHTEKGSERLFYKKFREEFTAKAQALSEAIIQA